MTRRKIPRRISSGIIGVLVVWVLVGLGVVGAVVSTPIVEEPLGENSAQTIVGDEVVGLRTETSKTYYLGNSTYAVEAALWPVHYQDEGWQEIDNAWVVAAAPWNWEMTHDSYHAYVLNQFTYGQILKFELEGESVAFQPMELQWTNDLSMIQTISMTQDVLVEVTNEPTELLTGMEGSIGSIRWNNAYGSGRHFEFTTTPGKLQTLLQLDAAPPEPLEYIITGGNPVMRQSFIFDPSTGLDIYVNGVLWDKKVKVQTVNDIEVRLNGEPIWYFWQAKYWDSGNSTEVATTILRKDGNDLWLDVLVPYEWLQTAVYPVFIDPDTGATYPGLGSTEDRDGKAFWSYPTNIQEEGYYAYCGVAASTYGDWLRASQFGFAIPSTATIVGIVAEIHRRGPVASSIKDSSLWLVDASGTNVGDDKASATYWPTSAASATYGGDSDTWGATLTPVIVNDSDFGVRLSPANTSAGVCSGYVYWVKITVYYTLPLVVVTSACSNPTASSLQANGEITDDGGLTVTRRGFVHAEGLNYALDFNGVSDYVEIPYLADYYSNTVATENFEWGIDTDPLSDSGGSVTWTIVAAGDSKAEIDTAQHYQGTRSARLYRDGTNTPYANFAQTGGTGYDISVWVRKDDTSNLFALHGDGTKAIYLQYTTAEALYYNGPDNTWHDTGTTIGVNTWALLEIKNINWIAGTYDIYQDGVIAQSGADMRVTSAWADIVRFQNGAGTDSEAWLDNILIGSPSVWTFETWINRKADSGTYERILSYSDNSDYDRYLQIQSDDTVASGFKDTVGTGRYVITTETIPLNTDTHIVTSFDGTYIRIYFDGVLKATSADFSGKIPRNSNYPFQIGKLRTDYDFEGTEDDIRIWEDVRTQNEIQDNMYSELVGTEAGLVGYWKLNEGFLQSDDFEWGIDTDPLTDDGGSVDWTVAVGGGTSTAEIDTGQHYQGTRSARLYCDGTNYVYAYFPQTAIALDESIEFWVRKDDGGDFLFYHGNGSKFINVLINASEQVGYRDDAGYTYSGSVTVGVWAALAVRNVNWVAGTYDIYLNGTKIQTGAVMRTGSAGASVDNAIRFQNSGANEVWIDNVIVNYLAEDSTSNENDGTITGADWVYQGWDLWLMKDDVEQAEYDSYIRIYSTRSRLGQKLPITNGFVVPLSFYLSKLGSPSGDITFTIRDLDDNVLATKVWGDAGALTTSPVLEEVEFDAPIFVNEWVRILVEYSGGDTDNCVRLYCEVDNLTPFGCLTRLGVGAVWDDIPGQDTAYILGYTPGTSESGSFSEGVYDLTIEDLTPETWYRVRAFAENSAGIGYGDIVTCQTEAEAVGYSFGVIIG